jgi:hypothetical protein
MCGWFGGTGIEGVLSCIDGGVSFMYRYLDSIALQLNLYCIVFDSLLFSSYMDLVSRVRDDVSLYPRPSVTCSTAATPR